jgi:hypothetical protein
MYILGDTFLRGYYAVYDFDQLRIGLAENSHYGKNPLTGGDIALIVASGLILIIILIGVVCCIIKKKKEK